MNRLVGILQSICLVEVVSFKAGLRDSFFLADASLLTTFMSKWPDDSQAFFGLRHTELLNPILLPFSKTRVPEK